mmetsp:Transcript_47283/g.75190  ORF Transcript_47283/g.75190 Transcript_47283/m.75190 type:complete len:203 (-) Transcript_47283:127-735(-)
MPCHRRDFLQRAECCGIALPAGLRNVCPFWPLHQRYALAVQRGSWHAKHRRHSVAQRLYVWCCVPQRVASQRRGWQSGLMTVASAKMRWPWTSGPCRRPGQLRRSASQPANQEGRCPGVAWRHPWPRPCTASWSRCQDQPCVQPNPAAQLRSFGAGLEPLPWTGSRAPHSFAWRQSTRNGPSMQLRLQGLCEPWRLRCYRRS